jgi:phosphoglucosamine mutase
MGGNCSDAAEEEIEALLDAEGPGEGKIDRVDVATDSYLEHIVERFGSDLSGLRVAVDCANGAYSAIAPEAFEQLGAEVTAIAAEPDGTNINLGSGATDLSLLQRTVLQGDFDLGIAFDGDGDRCSPSTQTERLSTVIRSSRSSPITSMSTLSR